MTHARRDRFEEEMEIDRAAARRQAPIIARQRVKEAAKRYAADKEWLKENANEYGYVGSLK